MALKDCIRKIGKPLKKQHRELLQEYLDEGLTDTEAVDKLLIVLNQEILNIAARAQEQGVVVAKRPGVLAEIKSIRGKQLEALNKDLNTIRSTALDVEITLQDIRWLKDIIAKDYLNDGFGFINVGDRAAVQQRLNKMFFINPDLFREGRLNGMLKAKGPIELNRAWDKMLEEQKAAQDEFTDLAVKESAILDRLEELTGERDTKSYFQEIEGFYSGVEVAVTTMPMAKGNAENIWNWLIKQPGVSVETRSVVQRNEDGKILRDENSDPIKVEETTYPELDWLGVREYLDYMGEVTKEQLQAFVKQRGVKVELVEYGEMNKVADASLQWDEVRYDQIPEAIRPSRDVYSESVDGEFVFYKILERNTNDVYYGVIDTSVLSIQQAERMGWTPDNFTKVLTPDGTVLDERMNPERFGDGSLDEAIADYHAEKYRSDSEFAGEAKWATHTLSGGRTNYRVMALKLPDISNDDFYRNFSFKFLETFNELPQADKDQLNQIYVDRGVVDATSRDRGMRVAMRMGYAKIEDFEGFEDRPIYALAKKMIDAETMTPQMHRNYTGSHWDLNNVLAHVRVTDRVGPNGEKVLLVEEVQSDAHQEAKIKGFVKPTNERQLEIAKNRAQQAYDDARSKVHKLFYPVVQKVSSELRLTDSRTAYDMSTELIQKMADPAYSKGWIADMLEMLDAAELDHSSLTDEMIAAGNNMGPVNEKLQAAIKPQDAFTYNKVPNLPFKNRQWVRLSTKIILREAATNGYDLVQWTTGDQQNERYKLEETVKSIGVSTTDISPRDFAKSIVEEVAYIFYDEKIPRLSTVNNAAMHVSLDLVRDKQKMDFVVDQNGLLLWANDYRAKKWVVQGKMLRDVIGKERSDQVLAVYHIDASEGHQTKVFDVKDMKISGQGMRNFYDEDLPNEFRRTARKLDRTASVRKFHGSISAAPFSPYRVVERTETAADGKRHQVWHVVGSNNREDNEVGHTRTGYDNYSNALEHSEYLNKQKVHKVHSMWITPTMKENALEDMSYFQGKRGAITFDEMRQGVIKLTESKDLSTFIHEAGHLYLEVFRSLAEDPAAVPQIKEDWAKILAYLGVEDGSQITRAHHEKFAQTFERYTMEGKAPSLEMQDAFSEFRIWMLSIYRKVRSMLDMPLPEEITGVFDRMLASDEAIREAEAVQEYAATFVDAEQAQMTPEEFAVYRRAHMRAHNEGVERQTVKVLAAMKRAQMAWYKDEEAKIREEVRAEAYAMPVYRALAFLQKGTNPDGTPRVPAAFKLDKASVLEVLQGDKTMMAKLPKPWIYTVDGGVHVDVAATQLGFKSGYDMLQAILDAPPKVENFIKGEAKARMKERYPDPMMDGSLSEQAVKTVHTAKRAEVIAYEMRKLRALANADRAIVQATKKAAAREQKEARQANEGMLPKRVELAAIKAAAKIAIGRKKIRNVRPFEYMRAERKAGRLAFAAAARGDYQQAYVLKLQQLQHYEMYRAATAAKAQSESAQKYLARFESPKVQKRLGRSDLLNEILTIIEGIELRKKSLSQVDRDNAMRDLRQAVIDGTMIVTPGTLAKIMDESINWQELTVEQFAEMRDMVKQLENMAKKEVQAIVNGEKVLLQEAVLDVAGSLYDNNKIINVGTGEAGQAEKLKRSMKQGVGAWLRTSSLARILDDAQFGAITRRIVVPMRRAYSERLIPWLHKAQSDTAEIYKRHFTKEEMGKLNKKVIKIEAQGETYSRSDLISMALNMGNEGNKKAVFSGVKRDGQVAYTEQGVRQMLSKLTAKDWAFVQDVWDYYDTYWDDQVDAKGNVIREGLSTVERRRRGIAPKKVEPTPFQIRTADGQTITVRGGYHPLVYDKRHSDRTKQIDLDDAYRKMQNGVYVTASTRAGATYDRMENTGMVVRLSLNVIDTHLREIIRDIAIGDEVTYLVRVLNNKDISDAFNRTGNEVALDTLKLWLTDSAVGELPSEGLVEAAAAYIRTGFTKSRLGWNAMVVALQFTGIFQTIAVMGTAQYSRGLGMYMRNPKAVTADALERSSFLHTRYIVGAWDKDVQDTKSALNSVFGPAPTRAKTWTNQASYTYFLPIMKAQQVVDVTTWMAAYEQAKNDPTIATDQEAVSYADSIVEQAQTSGFFSDRSGLERGTLGHRKNRQSQFIRIWTTLISYMLAKGNIAYEKSTHLAKDKNYTKPSELMGYLADMSLLFAVEGILSALLYGQDPDKDEPVLLWAAEQTLNSVVSGIPFVREIPAAMYGSGNTPVGAFADDLWDLGVQLGQEEPDAALRKAFVTASGTALHIPSTQINRFLDAVWDEEGFDWTEVITGQRDKDK